MFELAVTVPPDMVRNPPVFTIGSVTPLLVSRRLARGVFPTGVRGWVPLRVNDRAGDIWRAMVERGAGEVWGVGLWEEAAAAELRR